MNYRGRKPEYEYNAVPVDAKDVDEREERPARPIRGSRRWQAFGICKWALVGLPLLVLFMFGVLHILEMITGTSHYNEVLPDWGMPGHIGDGLASYPTDATRDVLPIPCHSHNDYWRRVPLFDALHAGCTGVEADVWRIGDELLVGHNRGSLTPNRTFRSLYIDPLVNLLDRMNSATEVSETSGRGVFDVDSQQPVILLVDFKTDGPNTFPIVSQQLEALREKGYLTFWDGEKVHSRAVTVVGTGNTPFDLIIRNSTYRDIFYDAPLAKLGEQQKRHVDLGESDDEQREGDLDLSSADSELTSGQGKVGLEHVSSPHAFNISNSYYASVSFKRAVGMLWRGHLSHRQKEIIRGQIRGAHEQGLKVRYWDTPSWPISTRNRVWRILMEEGADMLNVDDLKAAVQQDWTSTRHEWW